MMPEGLLDKLTNAEVRDLIAYLAGRSRCPCRRMEPTLAKSVCVKMQQFAGK